ncbi:aminotransferase class IV [Caulobacter hibisci]|uniref:Probable branched-chain-amino-acid aminotransferase n=1 Tax=Caulobacter hibisci TaxID=2035993 RepID=A0ABS0T298_9CAUL|nr:aminotransferase class IV [Caulobacter hibisci]MBI1686014.1 aminotransferase class IV [Caulobacter hibisci]
MTIDGVPLTDRGLLLGDGLFETLLTVDGAVRHLEAHLDRMAAGCEALGLPPLDRDAARSLVEAAPAAAGLTAGRAAVRLTLTAGSGGRGLDRPEAPVLRLLAGCAPAPPAGAPAEAIIATVRRNEGSPASRLKTLAYLDNVLARSEARAAGADEALMLNNRGHLACASAGNLFWLDGEALATPAVSCGVLAGLARGRVIAAARAMGLAVTEVEVGPEAVAGAQAAFLTNSLTGVRPLLRLDGRTLGGDPRVAALTSASL